MDDPKHVECISGYTAGDVEYRANAFISNDYRWRLVSAYAVKNASNGSVEHYAWLEFTP